MCIYWSQLNAFSQLHEDVAKIWWSWSGIVRAHQWFAAFSHGELQNIDEIDSLYFFYFFCRGPNDAFVCFFLQYLADILPKESIVWKMKMLRTAASYVNSRLHAVKAQTLVVARYDLQ